MLLMRPANTGAQAHYEYKGPIMSVKDRLLSKSDLLKCYF